MILLLLPINYRSDERDKNCQSKTQMRRFFLRSTPCILRLVTGIPLQESPMKALIGAALLTLLAGCSTQPTPEKPLGMANPASVYCVEQGGKLELRDEPAGVTGYCHLPDGRVVEEWTLYHAEQGK